MIRALGGKQPENIGAIFERWCQRHDGRGGRPLILGAHWETIVGDKLARKMFPVRLLDRPPGTLVVAVEGHIWLQEMTLSEGYLLKKLNRGLEELGQEKSLEQIKFRLKRK